MILQALVTSRLDYGNAVLFGVNMRLIQKLQMVQNLAARLIMRQWRCDHQHITPSLIALHWLLGTDHSQNPSAITYIKNPKEKIHCADRVYL